MTEPQNSTFPAEVAAEIQRARTKFPSNRMVILAMIEEFGELAEQLKRGSIQDDARDPKEIRLEGVQAACMVQRVVEEGDPVLDRDNDPASRWTYGALELLEILGDACKAILQGKRDGAIFWADDLVRAAEEFRDELKDMENKTT